MNEYNWNFAQSTTYLLEHVIKHSYSRRKLTLHGLACINLFQDLLSQKFKNLLNLEQQSLDFITIKETEKLKKLRKQTRIMAAKTRRAYYAGHAVMAYMANTKFAFSQLIMYEATACIETYSTSTDKMLNILHTVNKVLRRFIIPGNDAHSAAHIALEKIFSDFLRDIYSPYHTAYVTDTELIYNNGTVSKMARNMYNQNDFTDTAILADALEDAGHTDQKTLLHLRDTSKPHVRGCYVIDSILRNKTGGK